MTAVWDWIDGLFDSALTFVFEQFTQPLLYQWRLMGYWEEAYAGTQGMLLGLIEITLLACLIVPLERYYPTEKQDTPIHQQSIRTDLAYTLINKLGLLPLVIFSLLFPLENALLSLSHELGLARPTLATLLPDTWNHPIIKVGLSLLLLDGFGYAIHRAQHQWHLWWQLHALHHSQQSMTVWTENRNHWLDDILSAFLFAGLVRLLGLTGTEFISILFISRLIESMSHANVSWNYSWLGTILVSPRFHRLHHAIRLGHEGAQKGCNFGVLFSFWDRLFRTARYDSSIHKTGILDQQSGRNYGRGLLEQQCLGLKRLFNPLAGTENARR